MTEKEYLAELLKSPNSEVVQVKDGHVFIFTVKQLKELLRKAGKSDKVVVFVKHRVAEDLN